MVYKDEQKSEEEEKEMKKEEEKEMKKEEKRVEIQENGEQLMINLNEAKLMNEENWIETTNFFLPSVGGDVALSCVYLFFIFLFFIFFNFFYFLLLLLFFEKKMQPCLYITLY